MLNDVTFSDWLKTRRTQSGVTLDEFSISVGFSRSMLRKLESGERRPSGQIAQLLADYFQVPKDEHEAFVAFARIGSVSIPGGESTLDENSRLAPWRRAYLHRANLPTPLTDVLGREREEAQMRAHILNSSTRLLTLTGAPGIGKTRLALHVAWNLVDQFEDGVFFVDLAPIRDPDMIIPSISRALRLREEARRSFRESLLTHLRDKRMLLVLDSFEQVLDGAPTVIELLENCPWVRVLITSREALHVRGEHRLPLTPLALPKASQQLTLNALLGYPAIKLFIERARAVAPEFTLTRENASNIAAVCIALEGLPLAIELAAARSAHFSVAEMQSALVSPLKFLTTGARDLHARHRTLRAAIEWSYELLDSNEQHLFRRIGAFTGGFTLEALDSLIEKPSSTLDAAMSLADKHLIYQEKQPNNRAVTRFASLEAVREYAIEQMYQQGEAEEVRRKHATYYFSLVERADKHFTGPQDSLWGAKRIEWLDRVDTDHDNLRSALDWYSGQAEIEAIQGPTPVSMALDPYPSSEPSSLEKGLQMARALCPFWFVRGYLTEGLHRLMAFIEKVPTPLPTESRELRAAYGTALNGVGRLILLQGGVGAARPLLEESLAVLKELGDKSLVAFALHNLGSVARAQNDYAAARTNQEECLRLFRELGNKWGAAVSLHELGDIGLRYGDPVKARRLFMESLTLAREIGDGFGSATALASIAQMDYNQGDYISARLLWKESLQLSTEVGFRSAASHSLAMLGWTALQEGRHEEAATSFKEALLLAREVSSVLTIYLCFAGFGILLNRQKKPERATMLFGAAEALRESRSMHLSGLDNMDLNSEIEAAKGQLPEDVWDKAWKQGHVMTLDEVVAFAVGRYRSLPHVGGPVAASN